MEHYAIPYRYLPEKIIRIGNSLIYSDPFGLSLEESSHPVRYKLRVAVFCSWTRLLLVL